MTEYLVIMFESFKKNVKFEKFEDLNKAKEFGNKNRRKGLDVVIVRKDTTFNSKNEADERYYLEKFGYYKVYDFINKILMLLFFMLIAFFCYLYFKFVKK